MGSEAKSKVVTKKQHHQNLQNLKELIETRHQAEVYDYAEYLGLERKKENGKTVWEQTDYNKPKNFLTRVSTESVFIKQLNENKARNEKKLREEHPESFSKGRKIEGKTKKESRIEELQKKRREKNDPNEYRAPNIQNKSEEKESKANDYKGNSEYYFIENEGLPYVMGYFIDNEKNVDETPSNNYIKKTRIKNLSSTNSDEEIKQKIKINIMEVKENPHRTDDCICTIINNITSSTGLDKDEYKVDFSKEISLLEFLYNSKIIRNRIVIAAMLHEIYSSDIHVQKNKVKANQYLIEMQYLLNTQSENNFNSKIEEKIKEILKDNSPDYYLIDSNSFVEKIETASDQNDVLSVLFQSIVLLTTVFKVGSAAKNKNTDVDLSDKISHALNHNKRGEQSLNAVNSLLSNSLKFLAAAQTSNIILLAVGITVFVYEIASYIKEKNALEKKIADLKTKFNGSASYLQEDAVDKKRIAEQLRKEESNLHYKKQIMRVNLLCKMVSIGLAIACVVQPQFIPIFALAMLAVSALNTAHNQYVEKFKIEETEAKLDPSVAPSLRRNLFGKAEEKESGSIMSFFAQPKSVRGGRDSPSPQLSR